MASIIRDVYVWICSQCYCDNVRCYSEGVKPLPMFQEPCDYCGWQRLHRNGDIMTTALVPGSLKQISKQSNKSLAESFLSVDVLLIVDMSGSMMSADAPGNRPRYQVAIEELQRLQHDMPGKIGVVSFSSNVQFCPSGLPHQEFSSTDMVKALKFVKPADGLSIRFILISDGMPDDSRETLHVAKTFQSKIDTIYIGPENSNMGPEFLRQLAASSGGAFVQSDEIGKLAAPVKLLLEAGNHG